MKCKYILTKKFLIKEYIKNKKSTVQIANEVGCSQPSIYNTLIGFGINPRKLSESQKEKFSKYDDVLTKELLYKEYITNKKSMLQIAKELKCDKRTVKKQLKRNKISIRNRSDIQKVLNRKGKKAPGYVDGRYFKSHYCTACCNEITYTAWKRGTRHCKSCAKTGKNHPMFGKLGKLNPNFGKQNSAIAGKNNPFYGKLMKPRWGKYKNINMRSSWEIKYAKYLDENNIKWLYESKTFDLGESTYTPDFYLPETKEYIEIKGYFSDKCKEKIEKFKKLYSNINFKILQEKPLIKLGVL